MVRRPSRSTNHSSTRRGWRTAAVSAAAVGVLVAGLAAAGSASAATPSASAVYVVRAGDTLSGIAVAEHVPGGWQALAATNHIAAPYVIRVGEHLVLPSGSASAAPPASPFPVPVAVGGATQVITVLAHGSYATVAAWQKNGSRWVEEFSTTAARVGANGITDGATRHQNTNTTPTGTYTITQGFGVGANPGTKMPYHQVNSQDWWDEDPASRNYNQMRTAAQGGFPLTENGPDGSEHLINYPVQYHNALVINFNMNPAVPGRGAGIFLHDLGPERGATAGCVALPESVMTQVMHWIDPTRHPVIAID